MQNQYQVEREGESLEAILIEGIPKKIEIIYRNDKGDVQVGIYENGVEISKRATPADRKNAISASNGTFLRGYLLMYDKLGPGLRAQIPSDWHTVLGRWLSPKE